MPDFLQARLEKEHISKKPHFSGFSGHGFLSVLSKSTLGKNEIFHIEGQICKVS